MHMIREGSRHFPLVVFPLVSFYSRIPRLETKRILIGFSKYVDICG